MEDLRMYQYIRPHVTSQQVYQMVRDAMYKLDHEAIHGFTQVFPEQTREIVSGRFNYSDIDNYMPLLHIILMDMPDEECMVENEEESTLSIVKELVQWGADVNQNERFDHEMFEDFYDELYSITPLNMAVRQGYPSVIEFLLDRGAVSGPKQENEDVEGEEDDQGVKLRLYGAMMEAINVPIMKEIIEPLVKHGAKLQWYSTETMFKKISSSGRSQGVIKFFIEEGVDPFIQDKNGDNFLHLAFKIYCVDEKNWPQIKEAIDLLLEKGVDPEEPNKKGLTPIILATLRGDEGVLQKLLQHKGLLKNGVKPMDIGKKLVKQFIKTDQYLKNNLESDFITQVCYSLSSLFNQGHDDLLEIFLKKEKDWDIIIWDQLIEQNYKLVVYLMEKGSMKEVIKSDKLPLLLDESLIYNPVANLSCMLDMFAHLIKNPNPTLLEKLKVYIPKLNARLSKDLDALKKNINHEKLSQQFELLKELHEKFVKLKDEEFEQSKLEHLNDDTLVPGFRCKAEVDLKEKFEEGVKLVDKAYTPSHVYTFFTRNEGRDFSEETSEQTHISEKASTSSPLEKIMDFLPFPEARNLSEALCKSSSDFLNPQAFPQRCKELRDIAQNSGKHPLDSLSNSSDEPNSKRQAFDLNDHQINSGDSLPNLVGNLEEETTDLA